MFSETLLTKNPETQAGRELLELVTLLNTIRNHNQKEIWLRWFTRWEHRHLTFINQRSRSPDGTKTWWYTHTNVRKVYRSLKNSIDHLFLYLDYPGLEKDTNGLEAEYKHLKQKLSVHKGLKRHRKVNFIQWYFYVKGTAEL